jgi:antitoxin HigA-1
LSEAKNDVVLADNGVPRDHGKIDPATDMKNKLLTNITPGEILEEEFLKPMGITQYRLAKDIAVPARRINEIVKGQRAITANTALRLGRYFQMSPQFWLNLQSHYDLEQEGARLANRLAREVKVLADAA